MTNTDESLPSQSPIFYILWSGLYFSKVQKDKQFMWAINLFIGLSPTSSKSTTNSSLASLSLATVSFPLEFELGELIVINWPFPPFTLPCTLQLHSVHWNLRRARPQIQLHCGPSGLGGRARGSPICWFVENIYSVEKNFFDEYTYSSKKSRRLVLFRDGVSQHEHCVCFSSPLPPWESEVANQPKEIFWGGWTYQRNKVRHALCVVLKE